jgi:hypothetical protein
MLIGMPGRKRSTTPLMVGRPLDGQDPFGEKNESREWEDIDFPLDDVSSSRRKGGSLDRIPRQRGAVVAIVVICIALAAGAAIVGFAFFANDNGLGDAIAAVRTRLFGASREATAVPPQTTMQPAPVREAAPPAPSPPRSAASQPTVSVPAAPPASKAPSAPVAIPRQENKQVAPPPDLEGAERLRKDALAVRRRRQEDNYVWSQELHALVPASSIPAVARPPAQPGATPGRPPAFGTPR